MLNTSRKKPSNKRSFVWRNGSIRLRGARYGEIMTSAETLSDRNTALLREDEPFFEIINGERVELPPMSFYACIIATRLVNEIGFFAKSQNLGQAAMETLFHQACPLIAIVGPMWPRL